MVFELSYSKCRDDIGNIAKLLKKQSYLPGFLFYHNPVSNNGKCEYQINEYFGQQCNSMKDDSEIEANNLQFALGESCILPTRLKNLIRLDNLQNVNDNTSNIYVVQTQCDGPCSVRFSERPEPVTETTNQSQYQRPTKKFGDQRTAKDKFKPCSICDSRPPFVPAGIAPPRVLPPFKKKYATHSKRLCGPCASSNENRPAFVPGGIAPPRPPLPPRKTLLRTRSRNYFQPKSGTAYNLQCPQQNDPNHGQKMVQEVCPGLAAAQTKSKMFDVYTAEPLSGEKYGIVSNQCGPRRQLQHNGNDLAYHPYEHSTFPLTNMRPLADRRPSEPNVCQYRKFARHTMRSMDSAERFDVYAESLYRRINDTIKKLEKQRLRNQLNNQLRQLAASKPQGQITAPPNKKYFSAPVRTPMTMPNTTRAKSCMQKCDFSNVADKYFQ